MLVAGVCLRKSMDFDSSLFDQDWMSRLDSLNYSLATKVVMISAILLGFQNLIKKGWRFRPLIILQEFSFGLFFWHSYILEVLIHVLLDWDYSSGSGLLAMWLGRLALVLLILMPCLLLGRKVMGPKSVMVTGY